jgi:16S rRNA (adenine1518-N6/adenine1519-N6)-dimethyltransferase
MTGPRQVTLARLHELGIRPDRDLGQHFLADDNLLGVIDRLAGLTPDDVALEVGAGVGVLTAWLADRVSLVHAIEIDRRLEPALDRTLSLKSNVNLVFGDAMRVDLGALQPPVTAFVSNLPYSIAAPVLLDSIGELPACRRFCVLVQREMADRLLAGAGDDAYGAPSVLCGLALESAGRHAVSRHVFVPQPRVESSLVAFTRRDDWAGLAPVWPAVRATVAAAFSHRRKRLANSLALAGWAGRDAAEAACRAAGIDPGVRAEALPPEAFVALAAARP